MRPQPGERPALAPVQPASFEQNYLERLNRVGQSGLDKYLGYYFEYYLSMAYPGSILRTLVCLEEHEGKTYYQRTERIRERPGSKPFHGVYRGMVQFLSDRIFLADYETLTNFEMTQTVLYPSFRNRVDRLTGLRIGVSGSGERVPCCTRVLYEYLGREVDRQGCWRCAGCMPAMIQRWMRISGRLSAMISARVSGTSGHGFKPACARR
ncbi:hypothetical protein ULF88_14565 [Halopseudomonas pachastrellae]|nr:hypothetical protein [Halopseudomonas pachastrellae]